MGEASRRRARLGEKLRVAASMQDSSGTLRGSIEDVRYGGRLAEYWFAATERFKRNESLSVPCNGCTACCHHANINVFLADERPEDLAFLDLVETGPGTASIRRRPDGSCVHLKDGRCSVYQHRPEGCRTYDCRLASAIGIYSDCDSGQSPPAWIFDITTERDKDTDQRLRSAAAEHINNTPDWTVQSVLRAAMDAARNEEFR